MADRGLAVSVGKQQVPDLQSGRPRSTVREAAACSWTHVEVGGGVATTVCPHA